MASQSDHNAGVELHIIGVVQSCFKEKFGIPRQPGLAPSARARIRIHREFALPEAFAGLAQCSHIWVQFIFHEARQQWLPKVRPPRLGGNKKLGVFASRSPNRPNALGLSVVALRSIDMEEDAVYLNITGGDFLHQTPVLDIKPYVPYVDAVAGALNPIAPAAPILHPVYFSEAAERFCHTYAPPVSERPVAPDNLKVLITEILQQDPRPQYQALDTERVYGMKLLNLNLRWQYEHMPDAPQKDSFISVQKSAADGSVCCIRVLDIAPL